MLYVSYDIKGIQQFIFSVPRLKCMIGASGQIAEFETTADGAAELVSPQIEKIFAGGGRGVYQCPGTAEAEALSDGMRNRAHKLGLDLRIGMAARFADAIQNGDRLYPFFPHDLTGFPCAESGLWPTGSVGPRIHPLIRRRMIEGRTDYLGQKVLGQLHGRLPKPLEPFTLQFFKNVDVEPMDDDEFDLADDQQLARAAQRALGERNRWAVIAMDGNDMGRQFRRLDEDFKNKVITEAAYRRRVADASKRLREVTEQAFLAALAETLDFWLADRSQQELQKLLDACCVGANRDHHHARRLILPFRPLIVGGDDVVLLCHCSLAIPFVRSMSRHFTELSAQDGERIWPDTDRLTMSAGVLFTKSTLPLHIAIPYAENLLGSAKGPFRATQRGELSPAAVDWDNVTDSMVDTPAARRNRELRFLDCELDQEIRLTRRPYLLDEGQTNGSNQSGRSLDALLRAVDDLCNFPRSFLAKLPMVLRQPWSERVQFYTSIAKNKHYRPLAASLEESAGGAQNGCYWHLHSAAQGNARTSTASGTKDTSIVDAIALLEEDQRMQWRTVDAG